MATHTELSDLVANTQRDLNDSRNATIAAANEALQTLTESIGDLQLSILNPEIGASVSTAWTATIPDTPEVPAQTYPDTGLPDAPTLSTPDNEISSVPTPPTGSLDTSGLPAEADETVTTTWTATVPEAPTLDEPDYPATTLPTAPTTTSVTNEVDSVPDAPSGTVDTSGLPAASSEAITVAWTATIPDTPEIEEQTYPSTDLPTAPTIGAQTNEIDAVPDVPTWGVDTSGLPDASAISWPTAPVDDEEWPVISGVFPTQTLEAFDETFSYTEPTYTPVLRSEIVAGAQAVFAGGLGLPTGYWDAMWGRVAADTAKVMVGKARTARNMGSASYWRLPSAAVTANLRAIQDETVRTLQRTRLEQATQEAVFKREDFWKAMESGIQYEGQLLSAHQQLADRTLRASEISINSLISVYNTTITGFKFILEQAKMSIEYDDLKYRAIATKLQTRAQLFASAIEAAKGRVEEARVNLDRYQVGKNVLISDMSEQVKLWNGVIDADTRYKGILQQTEKLHIDNYDTQARSLANIFQAINSKLEALIKVARYPAEYAQLTVDLESKKAETEINRARTKIDEVRVNLERYKTEKDVLLTDAAEQLKRWEAIVEADVKYKGLIQNAEDLAIKNYASQARALADIYQAINGRLEAIIKAAMYPLEYAKATIDLEAKKNAVELDKVKILLDQQRLNLERYQIEKGVLLSDLGEQIKLWDAIAGADIKYKGLIQESERNEIQSYATQAQSLASIYQAINGKLEALIKVARYPAEYAALQIDYDAKKNAVELEKGKLTQSAQATVAQIEVAEEQWLRSLSITITQQVATLANGLAQAISAASDVALSATAGATKSVGLDWNYSGEAASAADPAFDF